MVTSAQLRAARSLLNLTVRDLAEKAGVHRNTITRAETDETAHGHAVAQVVLTLEAAGVEFTNGDQPGVRLKKTISDHRLDERERAEMAKTLAREWTAYCKEHESMSFASATGDLILLQFRKVDSLEVLNALTIRVLDRGFELDGKTVEKDAMERAVFAELESHPRRI
jgi:transcriptional regulator with XRE-family HTH domain